MFDSRRTQTADAGDLPAPPPDGTGRGAVLGRRCSAVFYCLSAPFCGGGGGLLPVTVSEQHAELLDFLDTDETTLVLCRAAVPYAEAGPGFAYAAPGRELREVWKDQMTNAVSGAELVPGWLPVFGPETVRELETALADTEKSL